MEENKAKEVKMNGQKDKVTNKTQGKLTYEQLNEACNQLFQQNQKLYRELEECNMTNMFKRLDYLFKVVENANIFNGSDFFNSCIDEIKEALTLPKESKESKQN